MATYSDIFIDQGSTFSSVIDVPDTNGLPFNLSSYTARGQIRKTYTSKNVVTFTTSIDLPLEGKVNISLTAGQTRAMKAGRYLYDIEIFNSTGHIFRIREGQVEISPGISEDNGGIELIPDPPTIYEIIDERIDARTIVTDKLLTLSAFEETNFYANSKLNQNLALKAPLDSPVFTGIPIAPTASFNTNNQQIATTQFVRTAINNLIDGAPNVLDTLNELADAIGNDANFSTTIINGLSGKAPLNSPSFTGTVSGITKAMVGLGDVDNTSDLDKPVSTATQTALNAKVDKVSGQGLSDENYTLIEKNKLAGIQNGATSNSTDAYLLSRANHTGSQSYTTITGLGTLATQSGTFSGSSSGTNTGDQTITLGGDATGSGTALLNVTLASTGVFAGEYNSSATSVTPFTVDIKGRITAVDTPITITPSWNSVTDKPTTVSGYSITDAVDLTSAQTISGVKDFTSSPTVPLIPTASGHAASKAYVDTLSEGLHVHAAVHALLKTPLATTIGGGVTITYSNGTNGVGAKLTASAPVTWTTVFNDSDIANDSRVIIAGQSTSAHNGIYVVSSSTELIRADDFNTPTEMAGGDFVFVTHGTYADTGWVLSEPVTEVGATAVIFTQFSGAGAYEAGAGLSRDGTTFSVVAGTGIAVDGSVSLSTVGSPGTYRSVTVDSYGRITSGTNPTTLSGYGITDAATSTNLSNHISDATVHLTSTQNTLLDGITVTSEKVNYLSDVTSNIQGQLNVKQPLDSDLTAIAALTGTSGLLRKTGTDTWTLDTNIDTITTSTATNLTGFISGNGTNISGATTASSSGGSGTLVIRDTDGSFSTTSSNSDASIIGVNTGNGGGLSGLSQSGAGGVSITIDGNYHHKFGIFSSESGAPARAAIERLRGWFVWFRSVGETFFTGRLKTADITANREWTLPNASGTLTLDSHTHSDATTSVSGFLSANDKIKLDGIASGAEVNVNPDWNATGGDAQILNKPTTLSGYGITDAATSTALSNHISDATVHLTSTQNTLLDGITVTSEKVNYLSDVTSNIQSQLNNKANLESPNFSGTVGGITKSMVGLGNVDNTSDLNKPISTATATALNNRVDLSESQTITGTKTINAPITVNNKFVTIRGTPTESQYGLNIINNGNFDPGTPLVVDGRARVVHGMTFAAGIPNFTNGSDHTHVQWTTQNRQSWQMIQNGGASNTNANTFTLTTVMTTASLQFFNESNIHSIDTREVVVTNNVFPFLATGLKINYNANATGLNVGDFIQITMNPAPPGVVANTYNGIVTAGPTTVTIDGESKIQYTFSLEGFNSVNWTPSLASFSTTFVNPVSGFNNIRVSFAPTELTGTRVSLTGAWSGIGRYVKVEMTGHNAFEGLPLVFTVAGSTKIGLVVGSYNAFVKKVIDANTFIISVGNAISGFNTTSGTYAGATGWTLYRGSTDAIHQYTPSTSHFIFHRFPTSNTTPTTTGGSKAISLGNCAEVEGNFSYSFGHKAGVFADHSMALGGEDSFINANYSTTVGGQGLVSSGVYQTIIGKYNTIDTSNTKPFIVGWGSSDSSRSNLLELSNTTLTLNTAINASGSATASSFIRSGGTSAQFLKADGTTQQLITGKTLYVDAVTGTDIRGPNSDYSLSSPFATIGEAVAASEDGDLVYVRAGSYTISSPISLNGKGNIYFETAASITIAGNTVAFSLTANETKTVNGFAQFALSNTAGILTQSNGVLVLEYQSIMSASTDTLFRVSGGSLSTSFAGIVAPTTDGFVLTGNGTLVIRRSHTASCKQFLNCNTSGAVTMDIWTVVGASSDATIRIVNHDGFSYRGVNLNNNSSSPCIVFAYTGGTNAPVLRNLRLTTSGTGISIDTATATRNIFLDQIKINATNSLSATAPTTVYSTTTYSTVAPDANVTVDGQYNIMSNLF
jgi:hypothetical protein